MHDIIIGLLGSVMTFVSCAELLRRKKNNKQPIDIINGIQLPAVDDPDWQVHVTKDSNKWNALKNSNVIVYWQEQHSESIKAFNPFIKLSTHEFFIGHGAIANMYVRKVIYHHMKYMVETPEIKQLDSMK